MTCLLKLANFTKFCIFSNNLLQLDYFTITARFAVFCIFIQIFFQQLIFFTFTLLIILLYLLVISRDFKKYFEIFIKSLKIIYFYSSKFIYFLFGRTHKCKVILFYTMLKLCFNWLTGRNYNLLFFSSNYHLSVL